MWAYFARQQNSIEDIELMKMEGIPVVDTSATLLLLETGATIEIMQSESGFIVVARYAEENECQTGCIGKPVDVWYREARLSQCHIS